MPPANTPIASIFWAWRSCASSKDELNWDGVPIRELAELLVLAKKGIEELVALQRTFEAA